MSKINVTITDGEDSNDILKPNGDVLLTIYRDDDSFSTAVKIFEALGFGVIDADGETYK